MALEEEIEHEAESSTTRVLSGVNARGAIMALGSETRWEIYSLIRSKPSHIEGLAERVRKHKSTVSRHVEVLEKAGLVKTLAVEGSRGARKNVYPTATRLLIDLS